ncbi:MAG: hypothetical protein HWD61_01085 [Parachlamydiaceae bacterium]|nr:MAG: hypothetical protein HWD61_01085 [Parachlamydiaceae bacterium]
MKNEIFNSVANDYCKHGNFDEAMQLASYLTKADTLYEKIGSGFMAQDQLDKAAEAFEKLVLFQN